MSSEPAVVFDEVTKRFPVSGRRTWHGAFPWSKVPLQGAAALDGLDLSVSEGEALGIIGPNGAGKSTLLKVLTGVISPTSGRVHHRGRIGAMIELGLGFHPHLTGRENVQCAGTLLGVDPASMRRRMDEIIEFAGLEDEADLPLREYSTGMMARLGFATASHVDADILVVDEVLSVGDREFQERCLRHITELVAHGTTLLFVSHELPLIRAACDRAIVIRDGRVTDDGHPHRVVETYMGRRTAPLDSDAGAVSIERFELLAEMAEPNEPLEFEAELVVHDMSRARSIQTVLGFPALDPDLIISECSVDVPQQLRSPGRHLVRGTTSLIPLLGGQIRLCMQVIGDNELALASASADAPLRGPMRLVKPMYALRETYSLTRIEDSRDGSPVGGHRKVDDPVLRAEGVRKTFPIGGVARALGVLPGDWSGSGRMVALDDVDLEVGKGDSLGLIGPNGAGKSTLLRCLAGVYGMDAGVVEISGEVMQMLELGVGFRGDLDGWENLHTTALLLGSRRSLASDELDAIVDFSGVRHAMGEPVKHWSTGMRARLGFAIATHLAADIILIDEVLAVGDLDFRRQAVHHIDQLRREGVAVVFVSHDLDLVAEVCDWTMRLEQGSVTDQGASNDVIERYGGSGWAGGTAVGTSNVHIHRIDLATAHVATDEAAQLSVLIEVAAPSPHLRLEFSIRDPSGRDDPEPMTPTKLELYTGALVIVAEEGSLSEPGWYRLDFNTGPMHGRAEVHMVVSAVDVRDGEYVAERWTTVHFGGGRRSARELAGTPSMDVELMVDGIPVPSTGSPGPNG